MIFKRKTRTTNLTYDRAIFTGSEIRRAETIHGVDKYRTEIFTVKLDKCTVMSADVYKHPRKESSWNTMNHLTSKQAKQTKFAVAIVIVVQLWGYAEDIMQPFNKHTSFTYVLLK